MNVGRSCGKCKEMKMVNMNMRVRMRVRIVRVENVDLIEVFWGV